MAQLAVVALGTPHPSEELVDLTAAVADVSRAEAARALAGPTGRAVLAWRGRPRELSAFTPGARATTHFRHDHKYGTRGVGAARSFWFRAVPDTPTGRMAANLAELEAELAHCDRGVLRHHCPRHDFSQWIADVFHDEALGHAVATAEGTVTTSSAAAIIEAARVGLIGALQARHLR